MESVRRITWIGERAGDKEFGLEMRKHNKICIIFILTDQIMKRTLQFLVLSSFLLILLIFVYAFQIQVAAKSFETLVSAGTADVGLMMFVGFAALYAYMKYSGLTGVGLCLLLTPLTMLLYNLLSGLWIKVVKNTLGTKIQLQPNSTFLSYYCAAAILISFGGVYGKVGFYECFVFVLVEVVFYALNQVICLQLLHCSDAGGSMTIHTFGATFGLAMCALIKPRGCQNNPNNGASKESNVIGTIGSMFLWVFWPSFNSLLVSGMRKQLAFVNTVLSLSMSVLSTVAMSYFLNDKVSMEDIINSTLAGGVVVGSSCDLIQNPAAALFIGWLSGIVATFGFYKIGPTLRSYGLQDTAGILNLHCMPGMLGGIYSGIVISTFKYTDYKYTEQFFSRFHYSFEVQGGYQVACVLVSTGLGVLSGGMGGALIKWLMMDSFQNYLRISCSQSGLQVQRWSLYNDQAEWGVHYKINQQDQGSMQHLGTAQPILLPTQ